MRPRRDRERRVKQQTENTPAMRGVLTAVLAITLLVALALGAVEFLSSEEGAVGSDTSRTGSPTEATATLGELEVASPGSMSGYSRERFRHWSNASDFGWDPPQASCDAREAALVRDGENVEVGSGCKVTSGSWYDPYTDQTYSDPQDLDIDHVVPLANAWRSGASTWNDDQRQRYANDPDVLLSVEDNANQEKGDKGPEAWKPPNEDEWCDYAERWISIKAKYDLSVNEQEEEELEQMLGTCEGS
jgi:hypothetical protein